MRRACIIFILVILIIIMIWVYGSISICDPVLAGHHIQRKSNQWSLVHKRSTFPLLSLSLSFVWIDSFKGPKCMFEILWFVSRWDYHAENTALCVRAAGERQRFKLHTWKTVTFRPCLDPWLPPLHNQSSYNENATNHHWSPVFCLAHLHPTPSLHTERMALTFQPGSGE